MEYIKTIINFFTKKEVYSIIATLAVSYFIYKTLTIILEEIINTGKNSYDKKKKTTITKLFENVAKSIIVLMDVLIILSIFGFNVKGMVAGLGITATIIGLALQDTLKDIINGVHIISENYFIVGDIVQFNTFTGTVIEFSLKSTKIRNACGEVLTIANRNIMEVKNLSQKEHIIYYDIPCPYEVPVDKVEKVIKTGILPKIKKLDNVDETSVNYLGVNDLSDSCVKYLISFQCKRDTFWGVKREVNSIVLKELNKNNISVPYPQLEVHYDK
jgi:small conductance mechanosensitive channel